MEFVVGTVEWFFGKDGGDGCTTRHDVVTGQLLSAKPWPVTWQEVLGTPDGLVAWDGTTLALFGNEDYATPLWARPSDRTEPLAISSAHVLVDAPSGALLLDRATGAITTQVASEFESGVSAVREGLVVKRDVNGDVHVLSMDPT